MSSHLTISDINQIDGIDSFSNRSAQDSFCTKTLSTSVQFSDIIQCDGADTSYQSSQNNTMNRIPVVPSVARAPNRRSPVANRVLRPIVTNNRVNNSSTLPVIAVANARSLLPKLQSTIEKVQNEEISILLLGEIWEKSGRKNRHFQERIEEMLQTHGYKYTLKYYFLWVQTFRKAWWRSSNIGGHS